MLAAGDVVSSLTIGALVAGLAGDSLTWALCAVPLGLVGAKLIGLYDTDHRAIRHLTIDEFGSVATWCALLFLTCSLIVPGEISVGSVGVLMPFTLALALGLRALARLSWRLMTPPERVLMVGRGDPAALVARKIELFADVHMRLERVEDPGVHLEYQNGHEEAAMNEALAGIERVVLAWSEADPRFIERLLDHCRRLEVKLSVISPFRGRARPAPRVSQIADLPILEYSTWDVPRSTTILKRGLDLIVSVSILVVIAPLICLIALAIKLGDQGPLFFRQLRAGKDGEPFTMFKFRSMCVTAEQELAALVDLDGLESPMFKIVEDPRVTRVGRFLRRFSLDELPQLVNVARGEMSLVGPRPEQVTVASRYRPEHMFRFEVKPGVTGPMQVFGRGELSFEERLAVEIDYVENVAISRDLRLLAQTMPAVLRGTGAF